VDGLRAFHCRRMALRLAPDAPISAYDLSQIAPDVEPVAEYEGFRYGQASLLACATGNPVAAFGPLYATLPPSRRVPRLPAPPYHFISRISSLSHPPGGMQAGVVVETAYDIPADAWYFDAHPTGQMPSCVLIEAALQPCGWLASYVGCAVHEADEVFFRNLDGKGVLHRAVRADDGCLRVRSRLKSISRAGGMTLVGFDVVCTVGDEVIYELGTTFGFFPKAALEGQTGLAADPAEREFANTSAEADLLDQLGPQGRARLPKPAVRMCERVTHREVAADGSAALRGEKRVRPGEWFFKAHFFQDPVQPGSLGIEALVQLLQAHLLLEGAAEAVPGGVFADMVTTDPTAWQFRGQVMPEAALVSLTLDAEPIEKADGRWTARAQGSVWVDGRRIYQLRGLTVSIETAATAPQGGTVRLDPAVEPWWNDHRPTYAAPVLPGMAALSLAMQAAPDVVGIDDLVLRRWLVLDQPATLTIGVDDDAIAITENGKPLADGRLVRDAVKPRAPEPLPPLHESAPALADPYATGAMFHGPAYQRVVEGRRDHTGCDVWVRIDAGDVRERLPHIVLDAGLHGVPHDAMERWFPEVAAGQIAYPVRVERFRLFAEAPRHGVCEVRVRPAGFHGSSHRFPRLHLHLLHEGLLWAELVLVEACLPASGLGRLPGESRRAFLRDGQFVAGARLGHEADGISTLTQGELASADWLPGTISTVYGLSGPEPLPRLQAVVAREHAAARVRLHPRAIAIDSTGGVQAAALPLLDYRLTLAGDDRRASAIDAVTPRLDIAAVAAWWDTQDWQAGVPALRALFLAACRRFVGGVRLLDPAAMAAVGNSPLVLLANHQVAVESVLAGMALPPVLGRPLLTLAKQEHRDTWVGRLAAGLNDDRRGPAIVYVDRDRQQDMLERLAEMSHAARSGARSLMVHVEGTRAVHGRQPVATISAVWADMAVQAGLTIVPLRFCSGLPLSGAEQRVEFPVGFGAQELVLGQPLASTELAGLPLNARRDRVLAGLAELEPYDLEPAPDTGFAARVDLARQRWSLDEVRAVFLLLQAEAQAWPLDAQGLPADAMAARDGSDPFWEWFEQHSAAAQPR
jgi:3-hydroxymyristoyl/3-hydroxydecanoyl-(acyl carrier protein) dehydratase/1-acyl-sn-glycerol-3-phosphate acyltransferase